MAKNRLKLTFFSLIITFGASFFINYRFGIPHYIQSLLPESLLSVPGNLGRIAPVRKIKTDAYYNYTNWVIVDNSPMDVEVMEKLALSLPDWRILVVTDSDTPCRMTNCWTFSSAEQTHWMLPGDTNWQNARHCFAIAHGARLIYQMDGAKPHEDVLQLHLKSDSISILVKIENTLFTHYSHFGQPGIHPQGFPVNDPELYDTPSSSSYRIVEKLKPPAIQHVTYPEWDKHSLKSFRSFSNLEQNQLQHQHLHKDISHGIDNYQIFDPSSPPVLIPPGTFSTYNSKNTLYTYNSLWSLLQLSTSRPEFSSAWQSLYVQRLLWEIDETLGFYPPTSNRTDSVTLRKVRNIYLRYYDYRKEKILSHPNSESLVQFLSQWDCPRHQTFVQCMIKLSSDLCLSGFFTEKDVELTQTWTQFLESVHYNYPKRIIEKVKKAHLSKFRLWLLRNTHFNEQKHTRVLYSSLHTRHLLGNVPGHNIDSYNVTAHKMQIHNLCSHIASNINTVQLFNGARSSIGNRAKQFFSDILVIIVFNEPHYENVRYLLSAFGPIFTNIVVCGMDLNKFLKQTRNIPYFVTFIQYYTYKGHYGYLCAIKAMQMGYKVKGYFVTGDDVVTFFWNAIHLDKDKIWMGPKMLIDLKGKQTWSWWTMDSGKTAYDSVILELTTNPKTQNKKNSATISHETFLHNLFVNSRGAGAVHAVSDTWYIPERFKPNVMYYFSKFYEKRTFIELVVPVVFFGIAKQNDIKHFDSINLWSSDREELNKFYDQVYDNNTLLTFHPVKLSNNMGKDFFCNTYLAHLLKRMS